VRVFGGSNITDLTATQGQIFDKGVYYYRNFTVPAGVAITVDKSARFVCSGKVDIRGSIAVTPLPLGAPGFRTPLQEGFFTIGPRGSGIGNGGASYPYTLQGHGSGGGLGTGLAFNTTASAITFGSGGAAGGSLTIEASEEITIYSSASIGVTGGAAIANTDLTGALDAGGAGGGSGGLILLSSLRSITAQPNSSLDLRGGNGAAATRLNTSRNAQGGAGGSGGVLLLSSPVNNLTGANILLNGGVKGADTGSPLNSSGGGYGGAFGGTQGIGQDGGVGQMILRDFVPIG
jgi:hypothetical protein